VAPAPIRRRLSGMGAYWLGRKVTMVADAGIRSTFPSNYMVLNQAGCVVPPLFLDLDLSHLGME